VRIDEEYLRHIQRNVSLTPELLEQPRRHMVGLATRFYSVDSERNNIGEKLPPLWADFIPRLGEVPSAVPGVCYGIVCQAEPDSELLDYTAAIEVSGTPQHASLPAGTVHVEVPPATYASFTHRGEAKLIDQTVNYIYSSWLSQSGKRHTYGPDLEIYGSGYDASSPDSVMFYAIPVA
jgi:predicted transcriptional regulator YdeE